MAKLDYQLQHQLFGRQGSLWELQVDAPTRTRIRGIVKEAGNSSTLTQLDQVAASSLSSGQVLVDDAYFRFADGNFAVVGRNQRDYRHFFQLTGEGDSLQVAYRPNSAVTSETPQVNQLGRVAGEFVLSINADEGDLPTDRDWYLVPIPSNMTPIMIEGRNGISLVSGIDFLARDGYLVMSDDPGMILPPGIVRVTASYKQMLAANSFVLSAPQKRCGNRWLSAYAYRTQSATAFKRAAAEYAGLFVFQGADVILSAQQPNANTWVYICASAGTVVISYPHAALLAGQEVQPGTIVSNGFEVVYSLHNSIENPKETIAATWGADISLDGIFPIKGLTWDGVSLVTMGSTETDPITSKPHIRAQFGEARVGALAELWEWQKLHERQTGVFLHDGLGTPALPASVDFWELLENFYGTQLMLILMAHHSPTINERMRMFVAEHRPAGVAALVSIDAVFPPGGPLTDAFGFPLVSSEGVYFSTSNYPGGPSSVYQGLSLYGDFLAYDSSTFNYGSHP